LHQENGNDKKIKKLGIGCHKIAEVNPTGNNFCCIRECYFDVTFNLEVPNSFASRRL
jgi:hypothetical protein